MIDRLIPQASLKPPTRPRVSSVLPLSTQLQTSWKDKGPAGLFRVSDVITLVGQMVLGGEREQRELEN